MCRGRVLCDLEQRLEQMAHHGAKPCDCFPGASSKSRFCRGLSRIPSPKYAVVHSYRDYHCIKMFCWNRQAIFFQRGNVTLNRFLDIHNRFFPRLSLADATRQAGTFSNKVFVFTRVNNHLSHFYLSRNTQYATRSTALYTSQSNFHWHHTGLLFHQISRRARRDSSTGQRRCSSPRPCGFAPRLP